MANHPCAQAMDGEISPYTVHENLNCERCPVPLAASHCIKSPWGQQRKVTALHGDFRFAPESDQTADIVGPFGAISGTGAIIALARLRPAKGKQHPPTGV
jgi:hypothetical protein